MKKKWTYSLLTKTVAFILLLFSVIAFFVGSFIVVVLLQYGAYGGDGSYLYLARSKDMARQKINVLYEPLQHRFNDARLVYADIASIVERNGLDEAHSNLSIDVYYNEDGRKIYSSQSSATKSTLFSQEILCYMVANAEEGAAISLPSLTIQVGLVQNLQAKDEFYQWKQISDWIYRWRYAILFGVALSAIVFISLSVYLAHALGRSGSEAETKAAWVDRIPLDIYLVLTAILSSFFLWLGFGYGLQTDHPLLAIFSATAILTVLLILLFSLIRRARLASLWTNTVIYRILKGLRTEFSRMRLVPKAAVSLTVIGFLDFIIFLILVNRASYLPGSLLFMITIYLFVLHIGLGGFLLRYAAQMKKIEEGGQILASGNLNYQIDSSRMQGHLKKHAENINNINHILGQAVEQQMQSERLKTELITNVSHDIKTPITSIVNYAELLSHTDLQDEKQREYVEIVKRQAHRLKKLTEDLLEASKAYTGNLQPNFEPITVAVLLNQALAEYEEKLLDKNLELVFSGGDNKVQIMADGRLLWRIFDNLLSNVCKYSQAGTRVYLDLAIQSGWVGIGFRNISNYPLNINSEELMERFVRGDRSRHTEGSGLGLSIARSLTEIQHGEMSITIDGDLFKIRVSFPQLIAMPQQVVAL